MTTSFMLFLIWVFFLHLVADFGLQTRWMADNKSSNRLALLLHVSVYSLALTTGVSIAAIHTWNVNVLLWGAINFGLHFVTDALTSPWTKHYSGLQKWHRFFCVIGFDQFLHTTALLVTTKYLL